MRNFIITWGLMEFETKINSNSPEEALEQFKQLNPYAKHLLVSEITDDGKTLTHFPYLTT